MNAGIKTPKGFRTLGHKNPERQLKFIVIDYKGMNSRFGKNAEPFLIVGYCSKKMIKRKKDGV